MDGELGGEFSTMGGELKMGLLTSGCGNDKKNETFFLVFRILDYQKLAVENFFWNFLAIIGKLLVLLHSETILVKMALILGTEYCKIDSNGRFKLPIALKRQLQTEDCHFVIRRGFTSECLELWTFASFQEEMEVLQKELNLYNIEDAKIYRRLTRLNNVDLDSNDRLLIPPEQKSLIGDSKEIVLQGTGKYIEIWERSAYDKMNDDDAGFASKVNERLGKLHGLSSASDAQ